MIRSGRSSCICGSSRVENDIVSPWRNYADRQADGSRSGKIAAVKILTSRSNSRPVPSLIRGILAGIAVLVILLLVGGLWVYPQGNVLLDILFLSLATVVLYFIVDQVLQLNAEYTLIKRGAEETRAKYEDANRRLEAILQLSRSFVEANEEREVVELLLRLSVDLVEAIGASFVPLDERGQPLTAVSYGDLPSSVMDTWGEYLASPGMRSRCGTCQNHGLLTRSCPLVNIPFSGENGSPPAQALYCLPLKRGDREYGILNLYLAEGTALSDPSREFLSAMLDETSLAIESIRLRRREMDTLRQLHTVERRADLVDQLTEFLQNVQETLQADYVALLIDEQQPGSSPLKLSVGECPDQATAFIDTVIRETIASGESLLLSGMERQNIRSKDIRSLAVAPLVARDDLTLGALLSANLRAQNFQPRHLSLLNTLANQVTIVVQNSRLLAEVEYQTMIAERTRLAREIHDGLAQTLGFLKLQTVQMQNYLAQEDRDKLAQGLSGSYRVLSEAYQDARQAIDGLRIATKKERMNDWLGQALDEFRDNTGLKVDLEESHNPDHIPPEVQAQLIRIIQEAFSNIRKHAGANQVWISIWERDGRIVLEIRDDGSGFSPEDVPAGSRYGLQGMRERSELIGADLQVISRPHEGTIIRVALPAETGKVLS